MQKDQFTIAIVGRPNVGKSTLFNRLVGKRIAIESPVPGTTRDRLYGETSWRGQELSIVDVAGVEFGSKKEIDKSTQEGVEIAISSADLILFVVDWNDKNNETDKLIARRLRKEAKKVLLVVNKADNIKRIEEASEFKRLGPFNLVPVSAISGKASGDLLDQVVKQLDTLDDRHPVPKQNIRADINLSIIGRPNVGKSTLLNTIIGEKRAVVSEIAGTTRDIVNVDFMHKGKKIYLADTAGIRRPGKIGRDTIESFSVIRSYRALKSSDIVILVIDASEGLVALDANILGKAKEMGKGIVLAVNKIDLIEEDRGNFIAVTLDKLAKELNFIPWLPVVFISAKDEENINYLLNQVVEADKSRKTLLDQEVLARILDEAKNSNNQLIGITGLKQERTAPPIFKVLFKGREAPHYTQIRYLENRIRDHFPMSGSPVFLDLIKSGKK